MTAVREVITLPEVAKTLGVARETVRRWAVSGVLPVFRYGDTGHWRAFRDDIDKFIQTRQTSAQTGQVDSAQ
jgi:excisionase family DNA binding protein